MLNIPILITKLTINSATITNSAGNYGIYNEKGIITLKNEKIISSKDKSNRKK